MNLLITNTWVKFKQMTVISPKTALARPPNSESKLNTLNTILLCSILVSERKKYYPDIICLYSSKKFIPSYEFIWLKIDF